MSHRCDARGFCPPGLRSQRPELSTPPRSEILMGLAHHKSVLSLFPPRTRQCENNLFLSSTAWKLPRTNRGRGKPLPSGPDTHFPAAVSRETEMNRDAVSRPSLVGTGLAIMKQSQTPASGQALAGWAAGGRQVDGTPQGRIPRRCHKTAKSQAGWGALAPTGPPLCAALVSMQSSPHPDLQAHPHVPDSLPKGEVLSRAHLVLREGSQPAWGSV